VLHAVSGTPRCHSPAPSADAVALPTGTAPRRIAITQSNYLPWKGFFDSINMVDEFVLYDDAQYTKRDWRNRNRIKTSQGLQWLTVPVVAKGRFDQPINATRIGDRGWGAKHWSALQHAYSRAAHFDAVEPQLRTYLTRPTPDMLSDVNHELLTIVCAMLGITTPIRRTSDYELVGDRTQRLVNVCVQAGASEYFTGPAARSYLDEEVFAEHHIAVRYFDYSGYPEYPQLWGEFEHAVSIVDLLFNVGPDAAPSYMKSFG
jgi:hypothetical protein